ncbi:hypothetical protein [Magnetospirillum sp. UT-4]|uniref:hypothetical protein n=1 Tax=Magnetospirillum sp. UT-4 TaxID=2681467 RepID=UPI0015738FB2|nr:hypothetical protein [Magnetospirillum sp. UT-4]
MVIPDLFRFRREFPLIRTFFVKLGLVQRSTHVVGLSLEANNGELRLRNYTRDSEYASDRAAQEARRLLAAQYVVIPNDREILDQLGRWFIDLAKRD